MKTKTAPAKGAPPRVRKPRRPSIAAILRESYRLHNRDHITRQAVRQCLR